MYNDGHKGNSISSVAAATRAMNFKFIDMPVQQENDANVWHQVLCTHRKGFFIAQPHYGITLHCGSLFITTSMAFLDFLKPLKWKGLKLSHGLNSRHVRNFMTFHIVSRHDLFFRKLLSSTKYLERNL